MKKCSKKTQAMSAHFHIRSPLLQNFLSIWVLEVGLITNEMFTLITIPKKILLTPDILLKEIMTNAAVIMNLITPTETHTTNQ